MLSRVARGTAAVLAALAAGVAVPTAVHATTDETVDVVYELTFDSVQVDTKGDRTPYGDPGEATLVFTCGPETCVLTQAWGGIVATADAVLEAQGGLPTALPGGYSASAPATGTICNESTDFTTAWTTDVKATAGGVSGGIYGEPIVERCSSGGDEVTLTSVAFESVITTSSLVSGECWFTDEGCFAEAEPSTAPVPAESASSAAPATPAPIDVPVADPEPASTDSSQLGTGSPAAPSVLSTLATPAEAGVAPTQLLWSGILTLVLVLLVALPTALLNSAVEQGSDRFSDWWAGRRRQPDGAGGDRWNRTWPWAAFGVLLAAILSSFVDPQFGFNPGSGRVLLSILLSFALDVVIGWSLAVWLVHRAVPGARHDYAFKPLTLLVVLLAVVFTRLTGFEPGIVFGLVAGVAFAALATRADEGRAALVPIVYGYVLAMIAWLGYAALGGGAASEGSFWQTFAIESLAAVAIGGMAALPIALFPIAGLPGSAIFRWNRWVWAGTYAVGLFSFFVVLMPMPLAWDAVGLELGVWIGIYLVYAVAAIVAWVVVATSGRRD
jgi:hypothetical protein